MTLTYYGKRAAKWLLVALLLIAATVGARELAWAQMNSGSGYAIAFTFLMILGILATVALGYSIYCAIQATK